MPSHSLSQVEDQIKTVLEAFPALTAHNVVIADSLDIAIEDEALPALIVLTTSYRFEVADENWQTLHSADIEIEAVSALPASGTISRANREALADVMAAIAADRSLGIGLQDIQEDDIGPVEPRGKDVDSASLKFRVSWFTPRDDWRTIATT